MNTDKSVKVTYSSFSHCIFPYLNIFLPNVSTNKAIENAPTKASNEANTRLKTSGCMSPYPTVVKVITHLLAKLKGFHPNQVLYHRLYLLEYNFLASHNVPSSQASPEVYYLDMALQNRIPD